VFDREISRAIFASRDVVDHVKYRRVTHMSESFIVKLSVAKTKADRAGRNQLSILIARVLAVIENVQEQPLSEEKKSQYLHALCAALACHNHMGHVIDLLKPGAEIEPDPDESMSIALIAAAFIGNIRLMKALLTKGVGPVLDKFYQFPQPLQVAARQGHQDAVLLLLENATDHEISSWYDQTLDAAATKGREHIVHLLLEPKFSITIPACTQLGLLSAAKGGHIHLFQLLLERDKSGGLSLWIPVLWIASEYGHAQLVRMALQLGDGVDVDAKPMGGPSALQTAASLGRAEVVRLLLAAGATRNCKRRGCRFDDPLCRAASNGHQEVVQILLDAGEDVNGQGASDSPLYAAAGNEELPMMHFLLERGADVHAHSCGAKAICTAAARGYDLVVRLLVAKGVTADGPGDINKSPMLSAKMGGQTHVVKVLTELGAKDVDPAQTKYAGAFASGEYPKRMLIN